ncbi:MAG: HAD family hydrolase [Bacteroidetes bacterium]|nr:HAD family hydrolase [Bacteroidota bacterium]
MIMNFDSISTIAFDADDTLWVNETYFRDTEARFAALLDRFETRNTLDQQLFLKEMQNLPVYGYGIKGFMLSMVECAIEISNGNVSTAEIQSILAMGKEMIEHPVELLPGIETVLQQLQDRYRLLVLTKGDLLDQERKLAASGLGAYFHHVEVMSDKTPEKYQRLLEHLEINPNEFLMIGNSLKSDVLPIVEIGAKAIHIPFHTTWAHEQVSDGEAERADYFTISSASELLELLPTRA